MRASVLLLTYNEARNLPRCLDALDWCDDILVLDSFSTDETVAIAQARGARVLSRAFDDFAGQRNHGLTFGEFRHEWVLHLDADEAVTPAFRDALLACEPPAGVDAYLVPSKLMLFGAWLRYSGMYPVYQVRLGHRDKLRFKQVGHGQREDLAPDRLAIFPEPYLHYSFSHGLGPWFVRHVRYAREEAELLVAERRDGDANWRALLSKDAVRRRRALKSMSSHVPWLLRPALRFFYVYLVRRGFLDGSAGLTYSMMLSVYEGMTAVIASEIQKDGAAAEASLPGAAAPEKRR